MNKLELAKQQGLFQKPTYNTHIVDIFFESMTKALSNGGRVEMRGLCAFKVKGYPGYTGRNPKSDEPVKVKPKRLPFFKCGEKLLSAILNLKRRQRRF